jgi:hypothetical protein
LTSSTPACGSLVAGAACALSMGMAVVMRGGFARITILVKQASRSLLFQPKCGDE